MSSFMAKGFTLWFTGLSGSVKSTLAQMISREFLHREIIHEVLDGDVVRTYLSKGLGFGSKCLSLVNPL
ncbi:MAG: adenylyl-sulfate kinase [Deltaproteobacteria bacterium]|nr:adenylyl-sulfate kinase [Deltaproteobacteria bacterium]MBW1910222.1 adenylyl-sulfate kinase [Deltaproteobacteria bacterium]MBW2035253.1 adenylyl-sulfate kinase [Deltaproteobacteria bacterium]